MSRNALVLRQSVAVLLVVAVVLVVGCAVVHGVAGAVGAVLGVLLVGLFFGVDLAAFLRPSGAGLHSVVPVVLLYVVKLVVFALLLVAVSAEVSFDHRSLLVAVVVETAVAAVLAVRAFARMQVPYVEP